MGMRLSVRLRTGTRQTLPSFKLILWCIVFLLNQKTSSIVAPLQEEHRAHVLRVHLEKKKAAEAARRQREQEAQEVRWFTWLALPTIGSE